MCTEYHTDLRSHIYIIYVHSNQVVMSTHLVYISHWLKVLYTPLGVRHLLTLTQSWFDLCRFSTV